jgi:hypothetical protein
MPVALNDLRRRRSSLQLQHRHHFFFDIRREMSKCTDCSRQFSDPHRLRGFFKTSLLSRDLIVKERELQAERRGLGVNTVSPSDDDCVFEFVRPFLQHRQQTIEIFEDNGRCIADLKRHRRVEHIGRRQAEMEKT